MNFAANKPHYLRQSEAMGRDDGQTNIYYINE